MGSLGEVCAWSGRVGEESDLLLTFYFLSEWLDSSSDQTNETNIITLEICEKFINIGSFELFERLVGLTLRWKLVKLLLQIQNRIQK